MSIVLKVKKKQFAIGMQSQQQCQQHEFKIRGQFATRGL